MSSLENKIVVLDSRIFWSGFKKLLPLSFFVTIFGVAFGLAGRQSGLNDYSVVIMSFLNFAGAAQFAVLKLWGDHIPIIPLLMTVFAVNARHLLMGATLYPWLRELPVIKRYAAMLLVSDPNWALSFQAFSRGEPGMGLLIGGGIALWSAFSIGTGLGVYLGSAVHNPASMGLDVVLGCFLLTMLVGGHKNFRIFVIWIVAAASSILAYWYLPENSQVVVGAIAGGLLGVLWKEKANEH